ncbi:Sulfotransferase family [Candidatus Nanopelagicaceae bacterium]
MGKSPRFHKVIPVFVGGTGRSGTTVMGDLLGNHPDVRTSTPIEIKFLSNRSGLLDVVFGREDSPNKKKESVSIFHFRTYRKRRQREKEKLAVILAEFEDQVWNKWWDIDAPPPHGRGLTSGISRPNLEKLMASLRRDLKVNRIWAARKFMKRFIALQDDAGLEKYWVETTPMNIPTADKLLKLFPNALFITMVRDPRDVIASLLTKNWGPTTPMEGLTWIEKRLTDGHNALKVVPAKQKITIALEDLAINNREETYRKLTRFLGISESPLMRKFFEEELTPENATSGRWKKEISSPEFDAAYAALEQRLRSTLNS